MLLLMGQAMDERSLLGPSGLYPFGTMHWSYPITKWDVTICDIALKVCNKSKNEDSGETPKSIKSKGDGIFTPKASTKSKQHTSRAAKSKQEPSKISSNSKGKSLKSGGNSNSNGSG
ncbi:Uncharacterized protein TCM_043585 [Theobroma cacao]|uniref:Uncharacterized protein n=1 Tax=Theobroma cacao TaxID=3641 RepID=A0A061FPJ6_THECC|nr:Uncharacterized protein TCM_043585 [Theobroma cacao]